MDPGTAAIIAGGAVAGAGIGALGGASMNRRTRALYRETMGIQRGREDTAYRRAVVDMRAAGINPLMAAGGPGGASSSTMGLPGQTNPMESAGGIIAGIAPTITGINKTQSEIDQIKKNIELTDSQIDNMDIDSQKKREEIQYLMAETENIYTRTGTEILQREFIQAGTDERRQNIATAAKAIDLLDAQIEETYGRINLNVKQEEFLVKQMMQITQNMDINEITRVFIARNWEKIMKMLQAQAQAELWSARPDWSSVRGIGGFIK